MSIASTPLHELQTASEPVTAQTQQQPIAVLKDVRRTRRWMWTSVAAVTLVGMWTFWPQKRTIAPIEMAAVTTVNESIAPLELKAFDAPVWTLAALPPPPPPPPAPPPALTEQLLAVSVTDANQPSAMFYRPSEDRILTVHVGDLIGGRTIKAIAADKVTLVWKAGTAKEHVEVLHTDPRNAPGGAP